MKQRLQAWGDTKTIAIVAAFAFNEAGQLLLLQRHKDDLGGTQWGTPGGRIEVAESAEAAMHREFREETGLENRHFTLLGAHEIGMPHGTVHMTSYRTTITSKEIIRLNADEHHAYGWFDIEELLHAANILWGIPTILRDFKLHPQFSEDPTLRDGSTVRLLSAPE